MNGFVCYLAVRAGFWLMALAWKVWRGGLAGFVIPPFLIFWLFHRFGWFLGRKTVKLSIALIWPKLVPCFPLCYFHRFRL